MHRNQLLSKCLLLIALLGITALGAEPKRQPLSKQADQRPNVSTGLSGEKAFIDWTRSHAVALKTVEAGNGFDDMQNLKGMVGDARIVALGEATHGTREFFELKHRLIEFLASQKGFTIFSIEANMPEAYRLNDYVLHGTGDPKELIKGMYFWTWNTQEVLAMVQWMREFNESGKGHIEFTGFDMQTPTMSMDIVRSFLAQHEPMYGQSVTFTYSKIKSSGASSGFGVGTATFPISAAAGKHITYSGYIQTDGVTEGWAGLWWRVDGQPGKVLAFDNMQDRGAKGTTPWTRYEISIDVPLTAQNINFGVLHPGNGTAWFDSLQVQVDGVPYADASTFDLNFESETPRGFYTGGQGYEVVLDKSVAHSGKQSLRSRRTATFEAGDGASKMQVPAATITRHLQDERNQLLKETGAEEVDWVIQNARLVEQFTRLKSESNGSKVRDEAMAENVKWIADHNPGAKLVLWAHNYHISRNANESSQPMGSYLSQWFGKDYVNFGFAFDEGSFRAVDQVGKTLRDFTVSPAPEGSLDHSLAATGINKLVLDLRQLPSSGPVAVWASQPHLTRSIGAVYSEPHANDYFLPLKAHDSYDLLVFVNNTTPARGN